MDTDGGGSPAQIHGLVTTRIIFGNQNRKMVAFFEQAEENCHCCPFSRKDLSCALRCIESIEYTQCANIFRTSLLAQQSTSTSHRFPRIHRLPVDYLLPPYRRASESSVSWGISHYSVVVFLLKGGSVLGQGPEECIIISSEEESH